MPSKAEILNKLREIVQDPSKAKEGKWYLQSLAKKVDPSQIETAIEEDQSLKPVLYNHFHLNQPQVRQLSIRVLRSRWEQIEEYLTSVPRILGMIVSESDKPQEMLDVLDTPQGREWLNRRVEELYNELYRLAWEEGED